ncbi:MAG: rod shape-determining protein MreC [Bacteroidales bacterium]|nr:rod shape-determining protein MreC [Bacteroidales bacterium]
MRALIDLIIHNKHWFVFLLLEGISLFFLFSYNGYQRSVYFTTANGVVGSTYNVISGITSYLHLQEKNHELEAVNQELREQIYEMTQKIDEYERDSIKRMPALPLKYDVVSAQVVNMTLHKSNNFITINKGEADGIRPEMGVICSRGVVGIVYMTSRHYSIVMPLLNMNSKISCRLRNSEYFGSLIWQRGYADIAYVTSIPRHASVKKGEIVETNGYSDIFPAGLPIGVVQRIGDSTDGMSYMLRVKLFANFPTLRDVSVITNYMTSERRSLEQMAEDPAKKNNLYRSKDREAVEEQKKIQAEQQAEKERIELERIKEMLERQHSVANPTQSSTGQNTETKDTVR